MIRELLAGFAEGLEKSIPPPLPTLPDLPVMPPPPLPSISYYRPTRTKMKKHLLNAIKEWRTQYRLKIYVDGKEYHAIYAYIRSAVYTLTFQYVGKKGKIPKLIGIHNGKPNVRQMRDEIFHVLRDRRIRAKNEQNDANEEEHMEFRQTVIGPRLVVEPLPLPKPPRQY